MDVTLRVSGGAPKKKKGGLEPSFTTEQIPEMCKKVMDDHDDVKDELLDQWNEDWSKSLHDNDDLLHMARQYGACLSSIVARLQGKSLTRTPIFERIEAWFKADDVSVRADQRSMSAFVEMMGHVVSRDVAVSMIPADDRKSMDQREAEWKALVGRHVNVDDIMQLTHREERRILREKSRAAHREIMEVFNKLTMAMVEVDKGGDARLVEEPLRTLEGKIEDQSEEDMS